MKRTQSLRAGSALLLAIGMWGGAALVAPVSVAAGQPSVGPLRPRFTTGGSMAKALAKLRSQLALTEPQEARVKLLMEQRAEALRRVTDMAMKSYRTDMEAMLSPAQAGKLEWPDSFYRGAPAVSARLPELNATQKGRLEALSQRRSVAMGAGLEAAQQKFAAALNSVLTAAQQAQFAMIQSHESAINVEDRP